VHLLTERKVTEHNWEFPSLNSCLRGFYSYESSINQIEEIFQITGVIQNDVETTHSK